MILVEIVSTSTKLHVATNPLLNVPASICGLLPYFPGDNAHGA